MYYSLDCHHISNFEPISDQYCRQAYNSNIKNIKTSTVQQNRPTNDDSLNFKLLTEELSLSTKYSSQQKISNSLKNSFSANYIDFWYIFSKHTKLYGLNIYNVYEYFSWPMFVELIMNPELFLFLLSKLLNDQKFHQKASYLDDYINELSKASKNLTDQFLISKIRRTSLVASRLIIWTKRIVSHIFLSKQ